MIFRLLYKAFPKAYASAMPTANFPDYKGQMELVFQHDGHGYYKFARAQDIPNIRYLRLQQHIQEHQARISEADQNVFVELLDKAYADLLSPREATQVQAKKEIGYIIDEMKFRHKELPVHVRVLADIAAVTLIRDDENPAEIDEAIHNAKVAVLQGQIKDEGFFFEGWLGRTYAQLRAVSVALEQAGGNRRADADRKRHKAIRLQDIEIRGRIFRQEQEYKEFLYILADKDVQAYNALLAGTIEHVLICYGRKSKEAEEAEAQVQAAKRKFKK